MKTSSIPFYILFVPTCMLLVLLALSFSHVTSGQLEIPEAKPVENDEFSSSNTSDTSDYLTFEDPAVGYAIEYPSSWESVDPGIEYGLAAFMSPDNSASVTVKLIPRNGDESLAEFGDDFKDPQVMQLSEFYRNSTTTLGGLPGLIVTGIFTYNPNVFQQAAGELGYTSRVYQAWGLSEDRDGFYGVIFSAGSKSTYDEYLPVAKRLIDSFTVDETAPVIQEDVEDAQQGSDEEADDTFVGSARSNQEEAEEEDND